MDCPKCHDKDTDVIDSRDVDEASIRRRRQCSKCKYRFTTYEKIEPFKVTVLKRSGKQEPYSRDKLIKGMLKAIEKRNISEESIENLADKIEQKLLEKGESTISSKYIGLQVINGLKKIDKVAYIRFASVYKNFNNCDSFIKEAQKLINKEADDTNS